MQSVPKAATIIMVVLAILSGCRDQARTTNMTTDTPSGTTSDTRDGGVEENGGDLIGAASRGDDATVAALLEAGASYDAQDAEGRTAMMAATYGHHTRVVELLVRAGANPNIRDRMQNNPFLYAGAEGYLDILERVAPLSDPKLTNRYGGTALIPACERGHVETVRFLLTKTAIDVNHVNRLGWTALLEAIILSDGGPRHVTMVELLLAHGADPNIADHDGVTPLAHARRRGQAAIDALLVGAGARP